MGESSGVEIGIQICEHVGEEFAEHMGEECGQGAEELAHSCVGQEYPHNGGDEL